MRTYNLSKDDKFMDGSKGIEKEHSVRVKAANVKEESKSSVKWSANKVLDYLSAKATDLVLTT